MFFIHEIDLTQKIYREIITCDPYIALFHAGRSCTNNRYKVLIRETENFYDIFEHKERDLTYMFYRVTQEVVACVIKEKKLGANVNLHAVFQGLVNDCYAPPQKTYMSNAVKTCRRGQGTFNQFYTTTEEMPLKNPFGLTCFKALRGFTEAVLALADADSPFNTPAEYIANLNEVKKNKNRFYDLHEFTKKYPR